MPDNDVDVAVVGAGLAGLEAARRLKEGGASVLVLEARDRVGGRTYTQPIGETPYDLGGQWIGPGQPRMYRLVKELGLEIFPTHVDGKKVLDLDGKVTTYEGTIPFMNPLKLLPLQAVLSRLDALATRVPPDEPWRAPDADRWDATTLDSWQRWMRVAGSDVRGVVDAAIRTIFGADPGELSLLHFLYYLSSNGGLMPLIETAGGFQQDRIVGGTMQISERLTDQVGRTHLQLDAPVVAIAQDSDGVTVESGAGTFRAARVVVAVPMAIAGRIRFDPEMPPLRDQLHQRVAMGNTVKVFALYDRPFWRDRGLSGEAVTTQGPIAVAFDNSVPGAREACLLAFIVGRPARTWSRVPADQRRQRMLTELARLYGPEAKDPIDYLEIDWAEQRFTGGCPIANFPPGTLSTHGPALRAPVGRIHWAGTETARECTGYMEGALESGERVAAEILARPS